MSKHPSYREKVKSQEKEAKRRVALGFGEPVPWDLGQWSHF